jgi:hypothetical protein
LILQATTHDLKQARAEMPAEALHIVPYASPESRQIFRASTVKTARCDGAL